MWVIQGETDTVVWLKESFQQSSQVLCQGENLSVLTTHVGHFTRFVVKSCDLGNVDEFF